MTNIYRVQLQPAYVLHQRAYRDSSAIVEVFSEEYGRRSLVAKGLKRPKSKLKGVLQPFQPLLISWGGKSELGTLTDAELYSPAVAVPPKYLPAAFYLNELLLKLLHKDDPHADIFQVYHETLNQFRRLSEDNSNELLWQASLRQFELALMQSIGYGLVLDHDVVTQRQIMPQVQYEYILDHGPVPIDQAHVSQGGISLSGQALLMLANYQRMTETAQKSDDQAKQLFKEARRLLRAIIDSHLGNKNLHSRELFISLAAKQRVQRDKTAEELATEDLKQQDSRVKEVS